MKVVSTVHCTGTGGHGLFPFSVDPASENKHSLTRVKYTRSAEYFCEMCLVRVSCKLGHQARDSGEGEGGLSVLYQTLDTVGGCGEHGPAPAPLSPPPLSLSKNESCCKAGPGNSAT